MIEYLSIDLETKSGTDLSKSGVYRYTEDPEFEILLFGYSVNGSEVSVIDVACGEQIPEEVLRAIVDESVTKWAFNAAFERICLSAWLRKNRPDLFCSYSIPEDSVGNYLNPASWKCSLIWSAYIGLPLSLEGVGAVLKLQDQKMTEGKALIKYFSVPCKPTKVNGGRLWNRPQHAPDKWATFKAYNKRDVEVEMSIQKVLAKFPVPDSVWEEYHLSEQINDRGIGLDQQMVDQAIQLDAQSRDELSAEMQKLTQLENPNSVAQMKQWLADHGVEVDSLDKKAVKELLKTAPPELAQALELRQQLARSSVKKYIAMGNCVCADGRCRGMFQFYGANRSGRWAGRLIQLQNLPQNHIPDLASARSLVKAGDYEMLRLLYEDVPDTLSQLIRTAFVPKLGYKFIVSDFSAMAAQECLPTNKEKDNFAADYQVLNRAWNAISPDPILSAIQADYVWLTKVYESVKPTNGGGGLIWAALGPKTMEIVNANMDVGEVHEDEEILSLDAELIDAFIEKHKGAKNAAKKVEIDLVARIHRHSDDPKWIRLGDKLEKLREQHEQGLINSIEFLKMLLELAREAAQAEKEVVPEEEIDKGKAALTELFNGVKNQNTPIIVERIVTDIDDIVKIVRFDGWQNTTGGKQEVKKALRSVVWVKYKIKDKEVFDKAYSYIEQYY